MRPRALAPVLAVALMLLGMADPLAAVLVLVVAGPPVLVAWIAFGMAVEVRGLARRRRFGRVSAAWKNEPPRPPSY